MKLKLTEFKKKLNYLLQKNFFSAYSTFYSFDYNYNTSKIYLFFPCRAQCSQLCCLFYLKNLTLCMTRLLHKLLYMGGMKKNFFAVKIKGLYIYGQKFKTKLDL